MVRSSNEISRENCGWPGREPSATCQFREYWEKKPWPQVVPTGPAERNDRGEPSVQATSRSSQSSHSVRWAAPRSGGLKSLWRSDEGRHIQKRG